MFPISSGELINKDDWIFSGISVPSNLDFGVRRTSSPSPKRPDHSYEAEPISTMGNDQSIHFSADANQRSAIGLELVIDDPCVAKQHVQRAVWAESGPGAPQLERRRSLRPLRSSGYRPGRRRRRAETVGERRDAGASLALCAVCRGHTMHASRRRNDRRAAGETS